MIFESLSVVLHYIRHDVHHHGLANNWFEHLLQFISVHLLKILQTNPV